MIIKVLRNSKIGSPYHAACPINYGAIIIQKIGPIIVVSIRIKPLVKRPEPLPKLLGSFFRKLNGLELDGNKRFSTSSRHGLKNTF